ncbi:MAG: amino acid adenylation domain-containing protein [Methylacidiphilales bacterium]|nr:amino acid adenylation domain-containing protein [Candidatus Methylacidiphilales bacterium]
MQAVDKRKNIENIYPLSPMQQGMLFHTLLTPESGIYIPQVCLNLTGKLDIERMQTAWKQAINNHPALRSAFYWEQRDRTFQIVFRQVEFPWKTIDWQNLPTQEQTAKLAEFLECDRADKFDLKKPPLMRLTLIKLAVDKYKLIWTQHHLILDGWSSALVIKEVFQRYYSHSSYYPNSRPYGDYIAWLQQQDKAAAKEFWQKQLQGFTEPTLLPILTQKNITKKQPSEQSCNLNSQQTITLQTWAKQHQLTLNTVLQGAFALLLSRYCNTTDVIFGATSSGRPANLPGVASMVGLFINTLPVRVQVSPQTNLIDWLQKIQSQQAAAWEYEYTSLLEIQEFSEISRGTSLFESILVFENYPVDASGIGENHDLNITKIESVEWTSFPITVLVSVGKQLSIKLKYDSERFTQTFINKFLEHFCIILEGMTVNYGNFVENVPLLTQTEIESITQWNQTQADYPQECIHQQFEAIVERIPNNIAVIFGEQKLTYQELNQKANQLANYLQDLGVKPETPVGICIERSLEMVIGILGIIKAGGAYVPLDPDYPTQRLEYIINQTQVSVILTNVEIQNLPSQKETFILYLDRDWQQISQYSPENSQTAVNLDNATYIIYTSGSTGNPKGVINTHHGLSNRLFWMQNQYGLEIAEPVLQKTPFSFDVSVWEFFWTLLNGGCLVMAKPEGHQEPHYLIELIEKEKITTVHFVPAMLEVFLETLSSTKESQKTLTSLKRVICSGEALSVTLQSRFFQLLDVELHNLYGPTEAAIDVTYYQCQPESNLNNKFNNNNLNTVPIGRPINNTQIFILDKQMQPVPIGIPGEIYIGGIGVARGYWGRDDLTSERFILRQKAEGRMQNAEDRRQKIEGRINFISPPLPFPPSSSTLLYKTGDLARYLDDGNIEYLGRLDNQVKIRGLRIELGEIEAQLQRYPGIKQAIIILNQQAENSRLFAYIVPKSNTDELDSSHLREFLAQKLPEYMIPSDFVVINEFPLLPNGKINRKVLPSPEAITENNPVLPRNSTEAIIANIWVDVLPIQIVGVNRNFFELGGNSLSAIRVNARLREAFQLDLPLGSVFEKPTVETLAEYIDILQKSGQKTPTNSTSARKEIEL